MEYTVKKLSKLASISSRTLRYYDEIDLLKPYKVTSAGYRLYSENEVDKLQQILFYKTLGLDLREIKNIINNPNFDKNEALKTHLKKLKEKKEQLSVLIKTVEKTIKKEEGEIIMSDKEKFEGFKKNLIKENEEKYGDEIREKYGDETIDNSNAKMMNMTEEEYKKIEELSNRILAELKSAIENNEKPDGAAGKKIADLHKQWLKSVWPDELYNEESHRCLGDMYVEDERFTKYYDDSAGKGAAVFLRDVLNEFIK